MKRILAIILAITFMIGFSSCNDDVKDYIDDVKDIVVENKPSFIGKVTEKYDNSCLVEVITTEDTYPTAGELVVVSTNIDDCPQYNVGDFIKIVYNGEIAESYPLQVFNVYEIIKVDENGKEI